MCDAVVDLGFALGSPPKSSGDLNNLKNLIKQIAGRFQISAAKAQVGVLLLGDSSSVNIKLNQVGDKQGLDNVIDALPVSSGAAPVEKVLENAYSTLFSMKNGARTLAAQTLVVLTAEDRPDKVAISNAAQPFKEAGIKVVIVGIGYNFAKINYISVVDDAKDLLHFGGPESLDENKFVDKVTDRICQGTGKCASIRLYHVYSRITLNGLTPALTGFKILFKQRLVP